MLRNNQPDTFSFTTNNSAVPMDAGEITVGFDAAGNPITQPVTTMRVRQANGDPQPITINGQSASDWKLMPDPNSPMGHRWEPL